MHDLNDMYYFSRVVEHGGFAAAARALGVPKSRLSRRVAVLEQHLGVRLIQRSTRRFSITDVGRDYHRHCMTMLEAANAAAEVVERTRAEPGGNLKLSCPMGLLQARVAVILSRFLREYPGTRIQLVSTHQPPDVIGEGFDIALRVRSPPLEDSDLVVHTLGYSQHYIVASPACLARHGPLAQPSDLAALPSLDFGRNGHEHAWTVQGPGGERARIVHHPRMVADNISVLHRAALDGIGMALLPGLLVDDDIAAGRLRVALPGWHAGVGILQAVFPSRRGMVPVVRRMLDMLSGELAREPGLARPPHWDGREAYRLETE